MCIRDRHICLPTVLDSASSTATITPFDADSKIAVADNSANSHIWNERKDFKTFQSIDKSDLSEGVITIGDSATFPEGIGDVHTHWKDDNGKDHKFILKNALYFPKSTVKVISVSAFSLYSDELGDPDEKGTFITSRRSSSTLYWDHRKFCKTIRHSQSFIPEMVIEEAVSYTHLTLPTICSV